MAERHDPRPRRNVSTALQRDFNLTEQATFAVDLPNGRYAVDAILGDLGIWSHDHMGVLLEGSLVDDVSTSGGQVVGRHYEVEVLDGQLTLEMRDLGGSDSNTGIEAVDITALGPPLPWLGIGDAMGGEGDSGLRDFAFPVSLSESSEVDVQVAFATQNGTATGASDFMSHNGTLTIPAGQTEGMIHVSVYGDLEIEPNETFYVTLNSPTNAVLSDGQGEGTIFSDEGPKTLNLSVAPNVFSEAAGTAAATATLTRTGKLDEAVTSR